MSPIGGRRAIDLLTVKIGADIDEALKGLDAVGAKVKPFAAGFAAAGAAAAAAGAAIAALGVKTAEWAGRLADLRDMTGLSLAEIQKFQVIGQVYGVGVDTMTDATAKLIQRMARGAEGSADLRMALDQLGISLTDAGGDSRAMGDVMTEVIGKLGDIENVTERNVTAVRLFGRSAGQLAPVLGTTSAEMTALVERAERLGLIMSDEDVEAADKLSEELGLLNASLEATGRSIGVVVVPMLMEMARVVNDVVLPAVRPLIESLRMMLAATGGGPGVAAQGIIAGLEGIDDLAALQQRFMMFWDRLPSVAAAAGESIDEIQAGLEEFGITATDLNHILFALEGRIVAVSAATGSSGAALEIENAALRTFDLRISLDRLVPTLEEVSASTRKWSEFMQMGVDITAAMRTPLEVYADTVEELDALLKLGAISQETYNRAKADAKEKVEELTEAEGVFLDVTLDVFDAISDGTRGVAESFTAMVNSIIRDLARAELQRGLTSLITGLFGGASSGSPEPGSFEHLYGRAAGGPVSSGTAYMVGERGPELFVPRTSGQIVSSGGMGAPQVIHHQTVNLNLNAIDGRDAARFLQEQKGTLAGLILEMRRESSGF
jgi:hypothetical protein